MEETEFSLKAFPFTDCEFNISDSRTATFPVCVDGILSIILPNAPCDEKIRTKNLPAIQADETINSNRLLYFLQNFPNKEQNFFPNIDLLRALMAFSILNSKDIIHLSNFHLIYFIEGFLWLTNEQRKREEEYEAFEELERCLTINRQNVNLQHLLQVSTNQRATNQLINKKDSPRAIVNKSIFNQVIGPSKLLTDDCDKPDKSENESVVSSTGNMPAFFLNDPMRIDESKEHILQNQFMRKGFGSTFKKPRKNHEKSQRQQQQSNNEVVSGKEVCESTNPSQRNNSWQGNTLNLKEKFVQKKKRSAATGPSDESSNSMHQDNLEKDRSSGKMNTFASKKRALSTNNKNNNNNNANANEISQPDSTVYSPSPENSNTSAGGQRAIELRMSLHQSRRNCEANITKKKINAKEIALERNQLAFRKAVFKPSEKSLESTTKSETSQFPKSKDTDTDIGNDADVDEENGGGMGTSSLLDENYAIYDNVEKSSASEENNKQVNGELKTENHHVTSTKGTTPPASQASIQSPPPSENNDPGKPPMIIKATSPSSSRSRSNNNVKVFPHPMKQDQAGQTSPLEDATIDEREFDDDEVSEISSISRFDPKRNHYLRRSTSQRATRGNDIFTDHEDSVNYSLSKLSHPNIHKRNSMSQIRHHPSHPHQYPTKSSYNFATDVEDNYTDHDRFQRPDFSSDTEGRVPMRSSQNHHVRPMFYPPPLPGNHPYMMPYSQNFYNAPPLPPQISELDPNHPYYPFYYPSYPLPHTNQQHPQMYRNDFVDPRLMARNQEFAFQKLNSSLDLTKTNSQLEELQKKLHSFQEEVKLMTSHQRMINTERGRPMPPLSSRDPMMSSSNSTLNDTSTPLTHPTQPARKTWDQPHKEIYVNPDNHQKSRFRNEEPFVKRSINNNMNNNGFNQDSLLYPLPVKLPTFTSTLKEIKSQPLDLQGPHSTGSPIIGEDMSEDNYHMTYPILKERNDNKIKENQNHVESDNEDFMTHPANNFSYHEVDDESFSMSDQQIGRPESLVIEYDKPSLDRFHKKIEKMKEREMMLKENQRKIHQKAREITEKRQKEEALRSEKKQQEAERKREIFEAYKSKKLSDLPPALPLIEGGDPGSRRMSSTLSKNAANKRPGIPLPNSSRNEPVMSNVNRYLSPNALPQINRKSIDPAARKPQLPKRRESSRELNGEAPEWASKHTSEVDLRSFDRTANSNASLRQKTSRTNSVTNLNASHQGSLSIINQQLPLTASRDLKLFVKPKVKSNRPVIKNAIQFCCLAGAVNQVARDNTLQKMKEASGQHFIILFRDSRCQYRGLYSFDGDEEDCHLIVGTGPQRITHDMVELFYKYNSGGKTFSPITTTKHLSTVIDAISIHNSYWPVRASVSVNSPNK